MRIALQPKRKLGFVTGTCKESFKEALHEDWEICNAIVLSWIMNTVSKNLFSGIAYASNAHMVWKDLRERFDKRQRLLQFLNGLNYSYEQARHQILMKTTKPTLNQAYARIIEDESQRGNSRPQLVGGHSIADGGEITALWSAKGGQ
ncbi:uncharacterized protein [Nicotiana tomentosiformis]|uniref:uncharacterized protein n=1 Tax=Nicotiana tomentosiformis TaxID=4098 RepID=UPI00051B677A|nr:uncharacterized protein LOC104119090 [Nicotiana tomentosiformis]